MNTWPANIMLPFQNNKHFRVWPRRTGDAVVKFQQPPRWTQTASVLTEKATGWGSKFRLANCFHLVHREDNEGQGITFSYNYPYNSIFSKQNYF